MKVKDVYNIDFEDLAVRAEESDYWEKSFQFFGQVKERKLSEMSLNQKNWLDKIEHGLQNAKH